MAVSGYPEDELRLDAQSVSRSVGEERSDSSIMQRLRNQKNAMRKQVRLALLVVISTLMPTDRSWHPIWNLSARFHLRNCALGGKNGVKPAGLKPGVNGSHYI
ncbi:hypothetical protein QQF64_002483 [Cirrhinus molitorella]|uniref:Uncharacterized protein n=1 Tax=Cirrhinus molitorella TaxID=172907 RepID=A0ABR3MQ98_9TELE